MAVPLAAFLDCQRGQGALVISSVKSHPECAGKHKELQSSGVLPACSGCRARGVQGMRGGQWSVGQGSVQGREGESA